jgi:NitT/TauT family transport system substrate-binding protein
MKSKLTPLAKLMIVLVIVGGLAAVVYFTPLKDKLFPKGKSKGSTEKITDDNVIRVGVNTWGGFAGGQYFNEGFQATDSSRFLKEYGFAIEFKLLDDFNQCREAWKTDKIDVMYATVDGFVTEVNGLKDLEPLVFFQCDWSRGGDAIVVRRGINSVADLEGKKIAFAEMTASHTFLLWMLEAGNLDYSKITPVKVANGLEAADLFKKGQVDAAVVWSPDDADCVSKVAGSKVLSSSREASNIIADVFVTKKKFLDEHKKELKGLVEGFFRGNAEINQSEANKTKAAKILAAGMQQPEDFCLQAINNVRLCTYGDNVNFFNIKGNFKGVTGEDIYNQMSVKYAKAGYQTNGVPNWRTVSSSELVGQINLSGAENAAENGATFTAPDDKNKTSDAISTKPVSISFATGSAILDENAKYIIDHEFVDIVKSFANSRIRIEGNTDNTGSAATNKKLSEQRAQAVADYLIKTYNFDANRFVIIGNGPDKPVADNNTPEGKARNRRTDFQIIPN